MILIREIQVKCEDNEAGRRTVREKETDEEERGREERAMRKSAEGRQR